MEAGSTAMAKAQPSCNVRVAAILLLHALNEQGRDRPLSWPRSYEWMGTSVVGKRPGLVKEPLPS